MKTIKHIVLLNLLFSLWLGNVLAQDDFYPSSKTKNNTTTIIEDVISEDEYSTATDYYIESREKEREAAYNREMGITDSTTYYEDEEGNVRITNHYFNGDNYDFNNEYYDYEYSSRIRRFHRNYNRPYYDDFYTNYYFYDRNPFLYGTSIYTSYGWWGRPSWNLGWSSFGGWSLGWNWGPNWGWNNPGYFGQCVPGYYGNFYGGYPYYAGYNGFYNNNYYNSYDRNSHYYGKRQARSGYTGYGRTNREKAAVNANTQRTFGQRYEAAVRTNHHHNNIKRYTPNNRTGIKSYKYPAKRGAGYPSIKTPSRGNTIKPTSNPKNVIKARPNHNYTKRPVGTKPSNTYNSNGNTINKRPNTTKPNYTKPSNIVKPRGNYAKPNNNYKKPTNVYTKPKNIAKPSYNKPRPAVSKPSYNRSSGNVYRGGSSKSYNRSSGSIKRSTGNRSPRR